MRWRRNTVSVGPDRIGNSVLPRADVDADGEDAYAMRFEFQENAGLYKKKGKGKEA
jgi:hypothetical protein